MPQSKLPAKGDRVRMTGIMPGDPAPLEVGDEGEVTDVFANGQQFAVDWASGRSLLLLPGDPFEIVEATS